MEHTGLWLEFTVASSIVIAAGLSLSTNAERLAEAMGWGHAFAGFVVLGWATSLPELTISVSAVTDLNSAGLSAGNITGSVIFNLAILAALYLVSRPPAPGRALSIRGVLPLGLSGLVMLSLVSALIAWPGVLLDAWPAAVAALLLTGYLGTTLHAWLSGRAGGADELEETELPRPSPLPPLVWCLAAGGAILVAGVWLARVGDAMADAYGLTEGFVGTLFLAAVSSLPELVAGVGAIRLGLTTMAAASILGSNVFNLGILGLCDLLHLSGAGGPHLPLLLEAGEPRLEANLATALALTAGAMMLVTIRRRELPRVLSTSVSLAMLGLYAWTLWQG